MKYILWIDNQAAGSFDVCQITELFLSGAVHASTNLRSENASKTDPWKSLGDMFPSITALQTRDATIQIRSAEIRSTKVPLSPHPQRVTVADFDMSFGSMVVFMVKWVIASIPAVIILFLLFGILTAFLGGVFGGVFGGITRGLH